MKVKPNTQKFNEAKETENYGEMLKNWDLFQVMMKVLRTGRIQQQVHQ